MDQTGAAYHFGDYRLDAAGRLLTRAGTPVTLAPKTFDLLVLLVERRGRVLERDELIRELWPDTFVEEANLTFQISTLRKALGADGVKWVETVPKHGYRFTAEVARERADGHPPADPSTEEPSPPPARSVRPRRYLPLALAGVALGVALVSVFVVRSRPPHEGARSMPAASAVPLTAYVGSEVEPSLSPDGTQVAFSWNGPHENNFDIYVKLVGLGEPHRLTIDPAEDRSPAWSPDGRQIAFVRQVGVFGNMFRAGIHLIPALGGGAERRVAEILLPPYWYASASSLAWTPDGKWLAAPGRVSEASPSGIWLLSPDTGERRRLTTAASHVGDFGPSFSPDGRFLAFSRFSTPSVGDVYLLPLATGYAPAGPAVRITRESRAVGGPAWTPDGGRLLFSAGGIFGYRSLRIIAIDRDHLRASGEPMQLPQGDQATTLASGRGGRLVYAREHRDTNLWRLPLAPRAAASRLSGASTFDDHTPDFSPDGGRLAFASTRSGTEEIWVANADGSNPVQMTSIGGPSTANPRWSRDSRTILFNSRKEGSSDLYLLDVATSAARRLTDDPREEYEARWSRDGRSIYFGSNRTGEHQLWRMPADGGAAVQVTRQGGYTGMESADGKWLFYGKGQAAFGTLVDARQRSLSIWKVPVTGGEETKVLDGLSYSFNFAVTARGIYVLASRGEPPLASIEFFDFATAGTQTLHRLDRPFWYGFVLAPDERSLVWSQADSQGSDLMLVEGFR